MYVDNTSITFATNSVEEINECINSLGVHIDQNLNWEFQKEGISKKIASGVSAIKHIRDFVPREILLTVYNSLLQPHFDYCSVVRGCCSKGLSQKLQKLQNRAALIVTFSNYDRNTHELLHSFNWHKLEHQRAVRKSIVMYNAVNNQTPNYLNSRFFSRNEALNYNLRNTEGKLSIPQPRTNYCKRSFSHSGVVLWNSLPNET